jgi:amphi-Trp domain-containing protein
LQSTNSGNSSNPSNSFGSDGRGAAMKKSKIKYLEERSVEACIVYLQSLIHGLKMGSVGVKQADQEIHLRPAGVVDFGLRVEQEERSESIKLQLSWRRDARAEAATGAGAHVHEVHEPDEDLPTLTRMPSFSDEREVAPPSMRTLDRRAVAEYQRLYAAARSLDDQGHWHLDKERLMQSLAEAGVDPLTQQELYSLALQADTDDRAIMFSEQVIDALKQVTRQQITEGQALTSHV